MFTKDQKLFVLLTYALAWAWWIPMAVTKSYVYPGVGWPTHLIALMAPALATLVVVAKSAGRAGLVDLWQRCTKTSLNRLTGLLIIGTFGYALLPVLFDSKITLADLGVYSGAPAGVLGVLMVLALNGFGEEIGWRGFLADQFLATESISKAAFKVWLVWAPWHIPLFFVVDTYRQMNIGALIGWAVSIYFGSVVLTWLYAYSTNSVLVVVIWHIAYNLCVATAASTPLYSAVISTVVIFGAIEILRRDRQLSN